MQNEPRNSPTAGTDAFWALGLALNKQVAGGDDPDLGKTCHLARSDRREDFRLLLDSDEKTCFSRATATARFTALPALVLSFEPKMSFKIDGHLSAISTRNLRAHTVTTHHIEREICATMHAVGFEWRRKATDSSINLDVLEWRMKGLIVHATPYFRTVIVHCWVGYCIGYLFKSPTTPITLPERLITKSHGLCRRAQGCLRPCHV